MSDPAKYRSKEEVSKMRHERDPIEHVRDLLLKQFKTSENELKDIDRDIRQKINKATEYAQNTPEPDISTLYENVLS